MPFNRTCTIHGNKKLPPKHFYILLRQHIFSELIGNESYLLAASLATAFKLSKPTVEPNDFKCAEVKCIWQVSVDGHWYHLHLALPSAVSYEYFLVCDEKLS
ncbi:hypothetical protein AK833_12750 [Lysinibacillus sp. F5]|nr:hypothetical protein AK833_12750 [Lysinibacillus sp. F5]